MRELAVGLLSVLCVTFMVFGAVSAGISENLLSMVVEEEPVDELRILTILPGMPTPKPRPTQSLRLVTIPPTKVLVVCPTPANWQIYTLQPGDTLPELAAAFQTTVEKIIQANCLFSTALPPGTTIHLPHLATSVISFTPSLKPSKTPLRCSPPKTWVRYVIQYNDTLTRLSWLFSVSVQELRTANCLADDRIIAGAILYVPNIATRTVSPTPSLIPPTRTNTVASTLARTNTIISSPTPTKGVTITFTKTTVPSATIKFTLTPSISPSPTPIPSKTPTPRLP